MKNKDMPAMPLVMDNGHPFHESDVAFANEKLTMGLTKREMFAMNAPDIPEWFIAKFKNKTTTTLVHNPKSGHVDKLCESDKEKLYFKWRWYYADMMLD